MQPPGPPFAFGHEIDLSQSQGSEPSGDAARDTAAQDTGSENPDVALRITVPRVGRPATASRSASFEGK
jgi:hypothetical protein